MHDVLHNYSRIPSYYLFAHVNYCRRVFGNHLKMVCEVSVPYDNQSVQHRPQCFFLSWRESLHSHGNASFFVTKIQSFTLCGTQRHEITILFLSNLLESSPDHSVKQRFRKASLHARNCAPSIRHFISVRSLLTSEARRPSPNFRSIDSCFWILSWDFGGFYVLKTLRLVFEPIVLHVLPI